jgi:hypothetical protein
MRRIVLSMAAVGDASSLPAALWKCHGHGWPAPARVLPNRRLRRCAPKHPFVMHVRVNLRPPECDIQRRPADQVRGSKTLWRLVCLNALGATGYLRWGRRDRA